MKNLIRLICLSLILLTTYATAEITIDDNTIHVETNNYTVQFDYGAITYIHNKLTDETYTLPLEQTYEIQAAILGRNEDFYASRAHTVKHKKSMTTPQKLDSEKVETKSGSSSLLSPIPKIYSSP